MSFSSAVKKELFTKADGDRHCRIAELSALLCCSCSVEKSGGGNILKLKTENYYLAKKLYDLIKLDFNVKFAVSVKKNSSNKGGIYGLTLDNPEIVKKILHAAGLEPDGELGLERRISPIVVKSVCCKRAYLRGAFVACGGLCDPEKAYHAEFLAVSEAYAADLITLLESLDLKPKTVSRKGHTVIYFKESGQIADILNIIGAHTALMRYENVRILKDVGNSINRHVNCETANMDKSISAAVNQVESINYIKSAVGLSRLPKELREIAELRLLHPEISIKEIGEKLSPAVGKSGVNHRLRKIRQIAENLRDNG